MSYVHCGYCGKRGHNRLGCPVRMRDARENPDSYLAKQVEAERQARQRAVESRTCSYCNEPGHNRRGCTSLKKDKRLILQRQEEYVGSFLRECREAGLGPGALIRVPQGNWEDPYTHEAIALVTDYTWKNLDFLHQEDSSHWGRNSINVLQARVVSTRGWDAPGNSSWYRAPKQNSVLSLTAEHVRGLLPKSFGHVTQRPSMTVQILGRVSSFPPRPSAVITTGLDKRFNLNPHPRDSAFSKRRVPATEPIWRAIGVLEEDKTNSESISPHE